MAKWRNAGKLANRGNAGKLVKWRNAGKLVKWRNEGKFVKWRFAGKRVVWRSLPRSRQPVNYTHEKDSCERLSCINIATNCHRVLYYWHRLSVTIDTGCCRVRYHWYRLSVTIDTGSPLHLTSALVHCVTIDTQRSFRHPRVVTRTNSLVTSCNNIVHCIRTIHPFLVNIAINYQSIFHPRNSSELFPTNWSNLHEQRKIVINFHYSVFT